MRRWMMETYRTMAISLKALNKVKATLPPRNLIYGPPGKGKSTLCNEFPGITITVLR